MAYAHAVDRTWRENILFAALIELTYRCNLNCSFCYNDTKLQGVPLATDEYVRFFEDLRDLGTMNLTLSGGEPLAHPEWTSKNLHVTVGATGCVRADRFVIHLGVEHHGRPALVVIDNTRANVFIDGELIRHLELDRSRSYQPSGQPRGGPRKPRLRS